MNRLGSLSLALILWCSAVTGAGPLGAQSATTSELNGRVTNAVGHPLQSVQIVAIDLRRGIEQFVLTDADGRFHMPGLRPGGPYRIEVRGLGYPTEQREPVFLAVGRTLRLDLELARPEPSDPTAQSDPAPSGFLPGQGESAGLSTLISEQDLHRIPVATGGPHDLLRWAPRAAAARPGSGLPVGNHRYADLEIDGVTGAGAPFGGALFLPLEAIQELRIDPVAFDVRRGAAPGLSVQAVTRSGTNDPVFSAAWLGGGGRGLPGRLTGSAAGPLVRDRAHFFVAGERVRVSDSSMEVPGDEGNESLIARIDLQIDPRHRALLRHSRGTLRNERGTWSSSSTATQLNSNFGDGLFNELRIGATSAEGTPNLSGPTSEISQQALRITNDLSLTRGRHRLTLGTSNDFMIHSDLGAVIPFQGRERVELAVRRWSVYLQDRWDARPGLRVSLGGRLDLTQFPRSPRTHPHLEELAPETSRDGAPPTAIQFSPRIAAVWEPTGMDATRIRGGVGLFSGLTPLESLWEAWTAFGFIDSDYRHPQALRFSGAIDRGLGHAHLVASVEGHVSRTLHDLRLRNFLLEPDPSAAPREGRDPLRLRLLEGFPPPRSFERALELVNTSQGQEWSLAIRLHRPVKEGWGFDAAWIRSDARDILSPGRAGARELWMRTPVPGDPRDPPLARSDHRLPHRIVAASHVELDLWGGEPTRLSLIFTAESGQPYSFVYEGDLNGDGQLLNDLIRVPNGPDDVRFAETGGHPETQSRTELDRFVDRTDCLRRARGAILERGACTTAPHRRLDLRIAREVPITETQRAEIALDLSNVGNLLNGSWGRREHVPYGTVPLLRVADADDIEEGRVLLAPFSEPSSVTETVDRASHWRVQLGVRYRF